VLWAAVKCVTSVVVEWLPQNTDETRHGRAGVFLCGTSISGVLQPLCLRHAKLRSAHGCLQTASPWKHCLVQWQPLMLFHASFGHSCTLHAAGAVKAPAGSAANPKVIMLSQCDTTCNGCMPYRGTCGIMSCKPCRRKSPPPTASASYGSTIADSC
jgi:hypothetical protein